MKKYLALVLAILFVLLSFAGCGNRRDPSQKIDELIYDLVDDYSRYQDDREPPPSVLDKAGWQHRRPPVSRAAL